MTDAIVEQAVAENDVQVRQQAPIVQQTQGRLVGYHFGDKSIYPGRDGVREVQFGDTGQPGLVIIKVVYSGTGKKATLYQVPVGIIITEFEETPIIIASADALPTLEK